MLPGATCGDSQLADMLNVIWQALKESVNKIGSQGTLMKCMGTFGSAVDLTCGNPSEHLAIGFWG